MQSARLLQDPHPNSFLPQAPFSFELDDYPNNPFDFQSSSAQFDLLSHLPPPPPPPVSAGFESLNFFSGHEQDDMLDFLRDIDTADPWEFNPLLPSRMPVYPGDTIPEESAHNTSSLHQQQQSLDHDQSGMADSSSAASVHSSTGTIMPESRTTPQAHHRHSPTSIGNHYQQQQHHHHQNGNANGNSSSNGSTSAADFRPKSLLSAPQKRMNHVKSEKRRRDTIRDGYLTLTKILSPSGPGAEQIAIPRRGRPKGSGRTSTGKKTGKGKSGVLFRAVEYIRFMEQACEALERECQRLEKLSLGGTASMSHAYPNGPYGGHSW